MAQILERAAHIRELIKRRLKQNKMTYEQLANGIGVSLPTIKRWLTKDSLPVDALDQILVQLGLTWRDLAAALEKGEVDRQPLPEKTEMFVAEHPQATYVYILLQHAFRSEEIQEELEISKEVLESFMLLLDRNGLIEYRGVDDYRHLFRLPIQTSEKGQFSKRFFSRQ